MVKECMGSKNEIKPENSKVYKRLTLAEALWRDGLERLVFANTICMGTWFLV